PRWSRPAPQRTRKPCRYLSHRPRGAVPRSRRRAVPIAGWRARTAGNDRSSADLPRRFRVGPAQTFAQLLFIKDVDQRRVDVVLRRPRQQDVDLADRLRLNWHDGREDDAGHRADGAAIELVIVLCLRIDEALLRRSLRRV